MPRIRYGGWLRSLDRRLDDLEAEGPVGIPWDEVLSRIRWYRRGRGLLVAVGWGFAQAIASRSSSSACFTKGHRLGAIGCAGGAPGHASAWGRVQAEPEHSGAKAVGAFAPGLKTYVPIGEENLSTLAPRSRPEHEHRGAAAWSWCSSVVSLRDVGTTLGPDRNLPHAASLARFRRVRLSSSAGHAPLRPRRTRLGFAPWRHPTIRSTSSR